jgi:curved DNA-binding protein CbpA
LDALVASASGSLERTPLANLFVYCLDRSLSGTLVLEAADGLRHAVYFHYGSPAKVRTGDPFMHLGRVLLEMGKIDDATLNKTLAQLTPGGTPHGRLLVQLGAIDETTLLDGLREQLLRKLAHLYELPDATVFAFYEGKNLLESWGGPEVTPIDALSVIWLGVRARPTDPRVDAALGQLGAMVLRVHPEGDFRRFKLSDRGRGIVDMLRVRPCTLAELIDAGVAGEREVRLVTYAFLITRHLDLGNGKPPIGAQEREPPSSRDPMRSTGSQLGKVKLKPGGRVRAAVEIGPNMPGSPEPPAAAIPAPELEARRVEIRERAEKIDKEDYFTMLGVDREAGVDALQSTYFSLAKKWHPDRLPDELTDSKELAAKVFARLTEAFQTLTDLEKRKKYIEAMQKGGVSPEEQEKVARILEAQMDFQKAEILLKKGDRAGAERHASRAAMKDPEQVDYAALLLWLRSQDPQVSLEELASVLQELDLVLAREPNHQRSLWYRGNVAKRAGNMEKAMKDFRKLIELDPRHVDATREVRLYEMRHPGGKSASEKRPPSGSTKVDEKSQVPFGDLLGKLFKK